MEPNPLFQASAFVPELAGIRRPAVQTKEIDTVGFAPLQVCESAGKEYAIEAALDKMQNEWKQTLFEIVEYRETGDPRQSLDREIERETERQRDRETARQSDRDSKRKRDRQTGTERRRPSSKSSSTARQVLCRDGYCLNR